MPNDLAKTPWNAMMNAQLAVQKENRGIDRLEEMMKKKRDEARAKGETALLRAGSEVTLAGMRQRSQLNGQKATVLEGLDDDGYLLVRVLGDDGQKKPRFRVKPQCLVQAENQVSESLEGAAAAEQSTVSVASASAIMSALSGAAPPSSVLSKVSSVPPPKRSSLTQFEAWQSGQKTRFATSPEWKAKHGPTGTRVGLEKISTGTWNVGLKGVRTHGFGGF
mmetsp:Transcript_63557/g.113093  ORF Transcript_63557/g.113093 Transcript_63557/m.113093 type:complete len:221 (+) Transcript_63557:45-707(+)